MEPYSRVSSAGSFLGLSQSRHGLLDDSTAGPIPTPSTAGPTCETSAPRIDSIDTLSAAVISYRAMVGTMQVAMQRLQAQQAAAARFHARSQARGDATRTMPLRVWTCIFQCCDSDTQAQLCSALPELRALGRVPPLLTSGSGEAWTAPRDSGSSSIPRSPLAAGAARADSFPLLPGAGGLPGREHKFSDVSGITAYSDARDLSCKQPSSQVSAPAPAPAAAPAKPAKSLGYSLRFGKRKEQQQRGSPGSPASADTAQLQQELVQLRNKVETHSMAIMTAESVKKWFLEKNAELEAALEKSKAEATQQRAQAAEHRSVCGALQRRLMEAESKAEEAAQLAQRVAVLEGTLARVRKERAALASELRRQRGTQVATRSIRSHSSAARAPPAHQD